MWPEPPRSSRSRTLVGTARISISSTTLRRESSAYEADRATLVARGCTVEPEVTQPGYIRAVVGRGSDATKIEWAHDSSWRFRPVMRSEAFGYTLHPVDLAINKVLALAGRDEPRDLLDTLHCRCSLSLALASML